MNRLLTILVSLGAAWLLFSCADERHTMERVLEQADRQNKAFDSITNVDSIALAARYFDRSGTRNERMKAHYLLASAYRDMGDAPKALESFHDAADRADTTVRDCDYFLLSRVHGQIATLLKDMQLPYDALKEYDLAERYSFKAKDSLMAWASYSSKAFAYYLMDNHDSVISISENAYMRLLHYDSLYALSCLKD